MGFPVPGLKHAALATPIMGGSNSSALAARVMATGMLVFPIKVDSASMKVQWQSNSCVTCDMPATQQLSHVPR